jgi:hypothetical protein
LDATKSMDPYIRGVKEAFIELVKIL